MKIGIVGLGNMGLGIAENLLNKQYDVYGFDINPERGALLEKLGGHSMCSCAEVGKEVSAVILMVFSPDDVRSVLFDKGGLMETLILGSTVMITATVGPEVVYEIEPKLNEKGVTVLDIPLMAGVDAAKSGKMHVLVGGTDELVKKYSGLLADMSSELYYVGDHAGMGQAGKMCLQTLFSLTFETSFEIITLTKKLNLNMDEMDRLYHNSGSTSELFHETQSKITDRVFTGTFNPLSILDKDIHLSVDMAKSIGLHLPASEGTAECFGEAMKDYGKDDIWAAVQVIEREQ